MRISNKGVGFLMLALSAAIVALERISGENDCTAAVLIALFGLAAMIENKNRKDVKHEDKRYTQRKNHC